MHCSMGIMSIIGVLFVFILKLIGFFKWIRYRMLVPNLLLGGFFGIYCELLKVIPVFQKLVQWLRGGFQGYSMLSGNSGN